MVAAPDVGWMASSAVLLVADCLLRFSFHFWRAVSFPSFFPTVFPSTFSFFLIQILFCLSFVPQHSMVC